MAHRGDPCSEKANPMSVSKGMTVRQFIDEMGKSHAFNAGRLYDAAKVYEKMLKDDCLVVMTLAGAMVPAGLGRIIADMVRSNRVDVVCATGANIYHDVQAALGFPFYKGSWNVDDEALRKVRVDRIYDIYVREDDFVELDAFLIKSIFPSLSKSLRKDGASTAEFHFELGKALGEKVEGRDSFIVQAAKRGVPVFCPSPGDSAIGMGICAYNYKNTKSQININIARDVMQFSALVYCSKKTGGIEVGGGAPKNYFMQTQIMLEQNLGLSKRGHDFFVQITTDAPHWGGLSGATPQEAVSWGKVKGHQKNYSVVYSDATIALPLMAAYVSDLEKRDGRRLCLKLENCERKLLEAAKKVKGSNFNLSKE